MFKEIFPFKLRKIWPTLTIILLHTHDTPLWVRLQNGVRLSIPAQAERDQSKVLKNNSLKQTEHTTLPTDLDINEKSFVTEMNPIAHPVLQQPQNLPIRTIKLLIQLHRKN
jgi:hypothetical protein